MEHEVMLLLQFIVDKKYITIREIERGLHVTRRQAIYRIEKLNSILKEANVPILEHDVHGITISDATASKISELINQNSDNGHYYLSKKERILYLYFTLFINQDYLSLNDFMALLGVSRSTVLLDIKDLISLLEENDIRLKNNRMRGYYLEGSEIQIRHLMMQCVNDVMEIDKKASVLNNFIDDFNFDIHDYSNLVIYELAEKYNIRFVGDRLKEFIYIFILLKARMQSGADASEEISKIIDKQSMVGMKEMDFTNDLLKNYKNTDFISEEDKNYICSWILGISYGNINDDTKDCIMISDLVGKIMTRFELLSATHYKNTEEIFIQLYSHFRPAYYRMLFSLPIYNPLCNKVKEEYSELYQLVEETMKPFNAIFSKIPEEELAYLTMHFASIFTNDRKTSLGEQRKTALVLCSNGIGSSALLYSELKQMFPELYFLPPKEFSNFKGHDENVDIVFATNYVANQVTTNIPIIRVSPIMSLAERYQVVRDVSLKLGATTLNKPNVDILMNIIEKYATINQKNALYDELLRYLSSNQEQDEIKNGFTLSSMIKPEFILLNQSATDWEDAITLAYQPMVEAGYITHNYVKRTIQSVRLHGPYIVITKHIALPHTKSEYGALKFGIGITVLDEPICFGSEENDPVKYIFSLSALDNEQHLSAMATLVELFNDNIFFELLNNASSVQEILNYVIKMENR